MPGALLAIYCYREEHRRNLFSSCANWPGVHFMNRGKCLKQTEPLPTQPGTSIDTIVSLGSFVWRGASFHEVSQNEASAPFP